MKSAWSLALCGLAIGTVSAERLLKAASLNSALQSRSNEILLKRSFDLHYVEEDAPVHATTGAWLNLHSKLDTLVLEQIEHLAESIECTPDAQLVVRFPKQYFPQARQTLQSVEELLIVTSHAGCNQPGTRMPYRAFGCSFDEQTNSASFALNEASWKNDFKMHLGFATTPPDVYSVRKHGHVIGVAKRDSSPTSQPFTTTSTASLGSFAFPSATNTQAASATVVENVAATLDANQQILPPQPAKDISYTLPKDFPAGLTVSCIECYTTGSLTLISGSVSADNNDTLEGEIQDAVGFPNGFMAVQADGLGARVALDFTWTGAFKEAINVPLPPIPLDPFTIVDLVNVGVIFVPQVTFTAVVSDSVSFQYGFDLKVPDKSLANISYAPTFNVTPTITGFENTDVTALPFNSSVGDLAMNLGVSFSPQLLFGATILDQKFGAAVFMNLPSISIKLEQVHGTDANCNNITQGTSDPAQILGNLTHIQGEVDVSGGVQVELGGDSIAYTPLSTAYTIATTCLAFDTAGSSYMPATAALAAATQASASASATGSSAAAPRFAIGSGSFASGLWLQMGAVTMCVILGGAMAL